MMKTGISNCYASLKETQQLDFFIFWGGIPNHFQQMNLNFISEKVYKCIDWVKYVFLYVNFFISK